MQQRRDEIGTRKDLVLYRIQTAKDNFKIWDKQYKIMMLKILEKCRQEGGHCDL